MYLDISCPARGYIKPAERRYVDPETVEVLFLNELVDNPAHTLSKCMIFYPPFIRKSRLLDQHHEVPVLGKLPAAFSSNGSVLVASDIVEALLVEHAAHTESEETALYAFPRGCDAFINRQLSEVVDYLLYENEEIFGSYTSRMLRSVYSPALVLGSWNSFKIREWKQAALHSSTVHSVADCIVKLEEVVAFLSRSVDITESMKLPLRITSKLFSLMSVLLAIPLEDPSLSPLADYLLQNPQMVAIEQWCDKINEGCRMWSRNVISWRKAIRSGQQSPQGPAPQKTGGWWEWLGWSGKDFTPPPDEKSEFVADKSHNVLFVLTGVSVLFMYFASLGDNSKP